MYYLDTFIKNSEDYLEKGIKKLKTPNSKKSSRKQPVNILDFEIQNPNLEKKFISKLNTSLGNSINSQTSSIQTDRVESWNKPDQIKVDKNLYTPKFDKSIIRQNFSKTVNFPNQIQTLKRGEIDSNMSVD